MNINVIKAKANEWLKVAEAMIAEEGTFPPMFFGVTDNNEFVNIPTAGLGKELQEVITKTVNSYPLIFTLFNLKTGLVGLICSKTVTLKNTGEVWETFIPDDVLSNPYLEIMSS